jgi:pyruvate ferredoxin oxidoreductase gamma subunit
VLGSAFFLEGFEVQDAPRYGAERRGAPIFAYVRAGRAPIKERGVIVHPDLVVVVDDTLVTVPAAGVVQGLEPSSILLIASADSAEVWADRLKTPARIITFAPPEAEQPYLGVACAGAAARLCGVVSEASLTEALARELADFGDAILATNVSLATAAYRDMERAAGCVEAGVAATSAAVVEPDWVDVPLDPADVAAPTIHGGVTSVHVRTGLWRTLRPVLEGARCNRCVWVCGSACPDGVITTDAEGYPEVDYEHCKGCMICVALCPHHAFVAIPERDAAAASVP